MAGNKGPTRPTMSFDPRKRLRNEFLSGTGSMDVTFKVGQESISAHKYLLVSSSDVFKTQFCGSLDSPSTVELKECTFESFQNLMKIIYGVQIPDSADPALIFDTLLLAEKYQIDDIIDDCIRVQLVSLAKKKETALKVFVGSHQLQDLAAFGELCGELKRESARTLHLQMDGVNEVYSLGDQIKDNPAALGSLLEELASVKEDNLVEKELKDMERENEIKNDEINQLQEKLKTYQVRLCRNCLVKFSN